MTSVPCTAPFSRNSRTSATVGQPAAARERALREYQATHLRLAAHEMRRPVGAIHGWLSMLEDGTFGLPPDAASIGQALDAIKNAANELQAMSDRLAVATMQGDRVERLSRQPIPLANLVADTVAAVEIDARGRHISIDRQVSNVEVDVDADLMRVALINLLSNAVRHAAFGVAIAVTPLLRDGVVLIAVSDDGPGISLDDADHIFDPWFRGADAADNGLGLGLSLVQRIALWHGGDVSLATELGVGTTFTIAIPLTSPRSDEWQVAG